MPNRLQKANIPILLLNIPILLQYRWNHKAGMNLLAHWQSDNQKFSWPMTQTAMSAAWLKGRPEQENCLSILPWDEVHKVTSPGPWKLTWVQDRRDGSPRGQLGRPGREVRSWTPGWSLVSFDLISLGPNVVKNSGRSGEDLAGPFLQGIVIPSPDRMDVWLGYRWEVSMGEGTEWDGGRDWKRKMRRRRKRIEEVKREKEKEDKDKEKRKRRWKGKSRKFSPKQMTVDPQNSSHRLQPHLDLYL